MQYTFKFYLQIFTGVQCGFLVSRGRCPICKRFRGTIAWPPRSPDLTPLDFSVLGYVKDKVFILPLPEILEELRARITEAVATIDADMIHRIWDEVAYRWDICRVTWGNHIEHLWISVDETQTGTAFCDVYHNTVGFLLSVLLHRSFL
jgi:hypothetical protein